MSESSPSPSGSLDPRTERMVAMRHSGWTLEEVGEEFDLTRERVRQLTAPFVDKAIVLKARQSQARLAADEDREAIMAAWRAGDSTNKVAERRGLDEVHVRRVVAENSTELERRLHSCGPGASALDRDVIRAGLLMWLRRFAEAHDGRTPGVTAFRNWKEPGRPEPTGFQNYFESWREACRLAGLPPNSATRSKYTRRWTSEDCLAHVRACADALGRVPTYADYEEYARSTGGEAPSGALLRFRLGRWKTVLTQAFADVELPTRKPLSGHLAPEQDQAHKAVTKAIQHGELVRPDRCSQCGKDDGRIEGHHEDYGAPLDVIWLCLGCHKAVHSAKHENWRAA